MDQSLILISSAKLNPLQKPEIAKKICKLNSRRVDTALKKNEAIKTKRPVKLKSSHLNSMLIYK